MTAHPTSNDWATSRGEKWLAQLARMEGTLAPIDEPLIGALALDGPLRIADVACGGGRTTLEIARRAPAGSVVHGFDISPALIEAARARSAPGVVFELRDIAKTAPDAPCDRLLSRFGVMFFDDPPAAFANLARWLRPGGRFAFAVWGPLADNPWMTTVRAAAAAVVDVPPFEPNAPGAFRYANAAELCALLEGAGFGELEVRDLRRAIALGGGLSPEEAARFALTAFASFGDLLTKAGGTAFDDACRSLAVVFSRHAVGGEVRMNARVHLVTGAR
jgi:SAM-dependent methyltransferase